MPRPSADLGSNAVGRFPAPGGTEVPLDELRGGRTIGAGESGSGKNDEQGKSTTEYFRSHSLNY